MKVCRKPLVSYLLMCSFIFILIYILNHFTLYTSDDFRYRYIYKSYRPTGNEETIKNIFDLVTSQVNHWTIWNGRFTGHSIVQIFMQFDKVYFNIFNSIVFVLLIVLIEKLSSNLIKVNSKNSRVFFLILSFFMLWWFLPEIGKTVLWISGSGNYLWTAVIDLLWFYLFTKKDLRIKLLPFTVLLAFLMGAGNENTSPAFILWGILYLTFHIWKDNFPKWKIIEIVSATVGFFLMISSPGSRHRAGEIAIFDNLKGKIFELVQLSFGKYEVLYLMIAIIVGYLLVSKQIKKEQFIEVCFVMLAHFACIYSLIASNEKPDRVFFGASILICLAVIQLLKLTLDNIKSLEKLLVVYVIIVAIKFGISYNNVVQDNYETYIQVQQQYTEVINAKKTGQDKVVLKFFKQPKYLYNAYLGTENLRPNSDAWFNQWMAVFFGVKSVEGEK